MGKLYKASPTHQRGSPPHDDGGRNITPAVIRGWRGGSWKTTISRHGISGRFSSTLCNRRIEPCVVSTQLFFRVVISPGFGARRMDGAYSYAWGEVVAAKHGKKKSVCIPRNWSERWKLSSLPFIHFRPSPLGQLWCQTWSC